MKKMYIGILILAVLFAASLYNVKYLEYKIGALVGIVEEANLAAEQQNYKAAAETLQKAINSWEAMDGYTHIFIRHSEIDGTTDAFYELKSELLAADLGAAAGAYGKLQAHLNSLITMEQVSLGSVF